MKKKAILHTFYHLVHSLYLRSLKISIVHPSDIAREQPYELPDCQVIRRLAGSKCEVTMLDCPNTIEYKLAYRYR